MNIAHPHASPKMFCQVPISQKYEQTPMVPICPMRNIKENVIKIVISAWSVWPNNWTIQIITDSCFLNRLVYRLHINWLMIGKIQTTGYSKYSKFPCDYTRQHFWLVVGIKLLIHHVFIPSAWISAIINSCGTANFSQVTTLLNVGCKSKVGFAHLTLASSDMYA